MVPTDNWRGKEKEMKRKKKNIGICLNNNATILRFYYTLIANIISSGL